MRHTSDSISNATSLPLSADTQAVARRAGRELQEAIGAALLTVPKIFDRELATNALMVAEGKLMELCKALAIELDSNAEREDRYARLRAANLRIRELETQLGNSASPELTQASLKVLAQRLQRWWKFEGLGHASKISFGEHGCEVELSCSLRGMFSRFLSATPVSDKVNEKHWLQNLRDRGFELVEEDGDTDLADTDASRRALLDLLQSRLPSVHVLQFENRHRRGARHFRMSSVHVYIRDIKEISVLPEIEEADE
ncbi:hypothetical protein [Burkholderia gladioli]|uniref:Uncharacterized protein n=1 Tax=Burkholderia gladioli (strain BSR3) TaxID=999541 RepID=F2LSD5_BURGS|nr:hypothetical protein [Burkholderia gladioli]AEA65731.1 hypothetical protein bgla_3p0300 [Burkholderia gladioli BSR3]